MTHYQAPCAGEIWRMRQQEEAELIGRNRAEFMAALARSERAAEVMRRAIDAVIVIATIAALAVIAIALTR
jgi:hypothetical protein